MPRIGKIISINASAQKGTAKQPQQKGVLLADCGLAGDAHADGSHRQLSLLAKESYREMETLTHENLPYGTFAENITTEGLTLHTLPVGTHLQIGVCEAVVTQIGKECHQGCAIFKQVGKCVMPKQGIFVRICKGGSIRVGDPVSVTEL